MSAGLHPSLRKKALERLGQYHSYPYTFLISPAGFGKSHLLSSFAQHIDNHWVVWVSLTKKDRLIDYFINHLSDALTQTFPGEPWEKLTSLSPFPAEEEGEEWARNLCSVLGQQKKEILLLFDQMHHIDASTEVYRLILLLMRHKPKNLRIIAAFRSDPTGEEIKVFYQQNLVLEITEFHLRLTKEDLLLLFSDLYHLRLEEEDLDAIFEISKGWQVLVHYIYLYLSRGGTISNLRESPLKNLRPFFDYLKEEVLEPLSSTLQGFLKDLSLVEEVEEEIFMRIYPGVYQPLIDALVKAHLISPGQKGKTWQLHPYLRLLLLDQVTTGSKERMQLRIAHEYLKRKDYLKGLRLLTEAGAWDALSLWLIRVGPSLIRMGHLKSIIETLQTIPAPYRKRFGRLHIVEGDYYRLHSNYDRALETYQEAKEICRLHHDSEGEMLALEGEVLVYLDTVQPNKADLLLRGELRKARRTRPMLNNRLLHFIAENLINIGSPHRAERIFRLLRRLNQKIDPMIYGRLLLRTGRLHEANGWLTKEEREMQNEASLQYGFREASLVHSIVCSFIGEGEKAKKKAQQGILFASEMKAPFVEAVGWARMGHAILTLDIKQAHLAEESYITSLQIFEEIGVARGPAEPLMGLTLLYGKTGKYDLALHYGNKAVALAKSVSDRWIQSLTQLGLGIASFYQKREKEALSFFEEAFSGGEKTEDHYLQTVSALWLSLAFGQLGMSYKQREWLERALTMSQKGEYDFLFIRPTFLGPKDPQMLIPLLIKKMEEGGESGIEARRLLEKIGVRDFYFHPGYTLKVETLGHFRVLLGDRELTEKDWQRSSAKRMFHYFLSYRNRDLPKEMIQEALWPDADEETSERDFKVALNALTKALEPERKARTSSYYILRNGSQYRLLSHSGFELDVALFEESMEKGLRLREEEEAAHFLEKGYRLYKGDFLPDNLYDDWVIEERERLRLLFLKGSDRLATFYLTSGKSSQSIPIAEKVIEIDPLWENAYRILMMAYHTLHNRTLSVRWYERCKQVLEKELGVPPMEETINLYRKMIEVR